ncbi:hypothetical protein P171DRAFT_128643 [Karstenula rhodostoma CBS 690.94]|uniref:Uncharacterized protein n=1 Tax=Karstenula rhodostoma CBS 690.94 TaxID=1392251 RepID=A0A9P4P5V9_9PLEO|nr:hypothetical protein P171DRAFT_128643 [Karstenula rhodostoma CBS 690.94]
MVASLKYPAPWCGLHLIMLCGHHELSDKGGTQRGSLALARRRNAVAGTPEETCGGLLVLGIVIMEVTCASSCSRGTVLERMGAGPWHRQRLLWGRQAVPQCLESTQVARQVMPYAMMLCSLLFGVLFRNGCARTEARQWSDSTRHHCVGCEMVCGEMQGTVQSDPKWASPAASMGLLESCLHCWAHGRAGLGWGKAGRKPSSASPMSLCFWLCPS